MSVDSSSEEMSGSRKIESGCGEKESGKRVKGEVKNVLSDDLWGETCSAAFLSESTANTKKQSLDNAPSILKLNIRNGGRDRRNLQPGVLRKTTLHQDKYNKKHYHSKPDIMGNVRSGPRQSHSMYTKTRRHTHSVIK